MLGNYFKIFARQLSKQKLYSALNLFGLGIGLACVLLILLYVDYELGFDQGYYNADRIARIDQLVDGKANARTSGLLAATMKENIDAIENVTRFVTTETSLSVEHQVFTEANFAFADPAFFTMFDFHWLQGDPESVFARPSSVVLTQAVARKYFGDEDVLGQTVLLNNRQTLVVSGVIDDLLGNTHLQFSAIAPMSVFAEELRSIGFELDSWRQWFSSTYVLLHSNTDLLSLRQQLPAIAKGNMAEGISLEAIKLADIHMHAGAQLETSNAGSLVKLIIFSAIAFAILLIAIINFTNMSMGSATQRVTEIGLRKSIGASRTQIFIQLISETGLLALGAMLLALVLVELLLPIINSSTGMTLALHFRHQPQLILAATLTLLALALLAGGYSAFYLSAFKASAGMQGEGSRGRYATLLRNFLVIVQFSASIAMIIVSAIIFLQLRFSQNVDKGFNPEQILVLDVPATTGFDINTQWQGMRVELLSYPGISSVTHSQTTPLRQGYTPGATLYTREGDAMVSSRIRTGTLELDPAYFDVYQLRLLAGRFLSESRGTDRLGIFGPGYDGKVKGSVLLNRQAARELGWSPQEAVGKVIGIGTTSLGTVAGVVADTLVSIKEEPASRIYYTPEKFNYRFDYRISIRLADMEKKSLIEHVQSVWRRYFPDSPLRQYYLQTRMEAQVLEEQHLGSLAVMAAALSMLISCFGLVGLASLNAERRTREIGIRKVMGGSVWSIVVLLTNDFSKLVLVSNVIAWPVAYVAMERWLENFAYRIDLTPVIFIGSGLIALCIAWVTVGSTAAKAASQKPVLALRYE